MVGTVCSCSGANAGASGLFPQIWNAWVKQTNATGGINGHPVKLIQMDDGSDPTKNLQEVKQLVEGDKVMALVGYMSAADASSSYLAAHKVPVVGGNPVTPAFAKNPDYFEAGAGPTVGYLASVDIAKKLGKHQFAEFYCTEAPACARSNALLQKLAPLEGLGYHSFSVSSSTPDYTAPCLAAKSDGVDAVYAGVVAPVLERLAANCAAQNLKPLWIQNGTALTNAVLSNANLSGIEGWSSVANYDDASIPGAKAYTDALQKYSPSVLTDPAFGPIYTDGWVGGELFKAAAEAANIGPDSSSTDVFRGLYALKNETLGGLIPPTTYTPGRSFVTNCYFELRGENGALVRVNNGQPTCLDPAKVAAAERAVSAVG